MINKAITSFFEKADRIIEDNPDSGPWVFSIAAGDKRPRRETVYSATEYDTDPDAAAEISDIIYGELERLEDEPVHWAWIELREKGSSRIWTYEPVNIEHPDESLQVLPDATSDASAHMAAQLVKVNDQLCSLMLSKDRLLNRMTVQCQQLAIDLTQHRTEQDIISKYDRDSAMAKAIENFAPMAQTAFAYWVQSQATEGAQRGAESEHPTTDTEEGEKSPEAPPEAPLDDFYVESVIDDFVRVCRDAPHHLTESRIGRVVSAYTDATSSI